MVAPDAATSATWGHRSAPDAVAKIRRWQPYQNADGTMLGYLSAHLPRGLMINDVRLMAGPNRRRWLAMPSQKQLDRDGNPITDMYDVPLMVARGYASLSFLHTAAEYISDLEVPTYIYHFCNFDPPGVNAGQKIDETLRELAPNADITFERVAVTPEQIIAWNLPTRPTKKTDTRSKNFGAISVELDVIEPSMFRGLVGEVIQRHLSPDQFAILKIAEKSERELIAGLVGMIAGEDAP